MQVHVLRSCRLAQLWQHQGPCDTAQSVRVSPFVWSVLRAVIDQRMDTHSPASAVEEFATVFSGSYFRCVGKPNRKSQAKKSAGGARGRRYVCSLILGDFLCVRACLCCVTRGHKSSPFSLCPLGCTHRAGEAVADEEP